MTDWYARVVDGAIVGVDRQAHVAQNLGIEWVTGDLETGLRWKEPDPRSPSVLRDFEFRPITDQQATNWRAHGVLDYEETQWDV